MSFFLKAGSYFIALMYYIFFIRSLVKEHVGSFHFLAIMNKATMDMVEQVSLWLDGESFDMYNSGIMGLEIG